MKTFSSLSLPQVIMPTLLFAITLCIDSSYFLCPDFTWPTNPHFLISHNLISPSCDTDTSLFEYKASPVTESEWASMLFTILSCKSKNTWLVVYHPHKMVFVACDDHVVPADDPVDLEVDVVLLGVFEEVGLLASLDIEDHCNGVVHVSTDQLLLVLEHAHWSGQFNFVFLLVNVFFEEFVAELRSTREFPHLDASIGTWRKQRIELRQHLPDRIVVCLKRVLQEVLWLWEVPKLNYSFRSRSANVIFIIFLKVPAGK